MQSLQLHYCVKYHHSLSHSFHDPLFFPVSQSQREKQLDVPVDCTGSCLLAETQARPDIQFPTHQIDQGNNVCFSYLQTIICQSALSQITFCQP